MIIADPKSNEGTPVRMKRRHSGTLRINNGTSDSGVAGFPVINDYASHVLIRITRTVVENEGGDECQMLYGLDGRAKSQDTTVVSPEITVLVRDFWSDSPFPVGSIVRLIAPLKRSEQVYEVNAECGIIITEPNTLISCTTMAGMTFCPRKTVFSDRFRGSGSSFAMLLGTIVHELFQVVSRQYLFNEYRIHHIAEVCVELVSLGETLAHFEVELMVYLESVSRWLREYAPSRRSRSGIVTSPNIKRMPLDRRLSVCLDSVVDIEDNVWSSTLGVKGKIDVSFKSYNSPDVFPLELKTGKPHFVEHLSQVMLYSLMYSETMNSGRVVPGFLLYMKDNAIRQISPKTTELRGVLQMRNRVVPYFSRLSLDGFPKPLQNKRLCSYCEHSSTCALVHQLNSQKSTNQPEMVDSINDHLFQYDAISTEMSEFLSTQVSHLKECDFEYARHWLQHIFGQWSTAKQGGKMDRVFFDPPEIREAGGNCIANMKLASTTRTENGKYCLKFVKKDGSDLVGVKLEAGNFVIVSTPKQVAIYLHSLSSVDDKSVTLTSDKLYIRTRASDDEVYAIDKYESYTSFGLRLGNLALLMTDSERMTNLRSLIIGGRKPVFGTMSKESRMSFVSVKGQLDPTCKNQGVALMNALKLEDYMIVHGENEADRLRTALLMVQCFLKKNWSILLTSYSWDLLNSATLQLLEHVDGREMLRIAAPSMDPSALNDTSDQLLQLLRLEAKMSKFDERKSSEYFDSTRSLLMDTRILIAPCAKVSNESIFSIRTFDVCVVLDAHLITEPNLIRPLMQSNSFALVGDLESEKSGSEMHLMQRLANLFPSVVTRLGKV